MKNSTSGNGRDIPRTASQAATAADDGRELVAAVDKFADHHKINMSDACRRAKVSRSLWTRWKDRPPKSLSVYASLKRAVEEIVRERKEKAAQAEKVTTGPGA